MAVIIFTRRTRHAPTWHQTCGKGKSGKLEVVTRVGLRRLYRWVRGYSLWGRDVDRGCQWGSCRMTKNHREGLRTSTSESISAGALEKRSALFFARKKNLIRQFRSGSRRSSHSGKIRPLKSVERSRTPLAKHDTLAHRGVWVVTLAECEIRIVQTSS